MTKWSIILPCHKIWFCVFALCSWRCPPPTGRATRPSPSLWLRSWSLAGRRTVSSGLRRRSINPVLWSFRCVELVEAFWPAGAAPPQLGNASEENCSATAGSTVPSPAQSPWTRPRALQPTRRSRIRNLITGRTQVSQQSQVKLKYLTEIELSNNAPEAKLLQVNFIFRALSLFIWHKDSDVL